MKKLELEKNHNTSSKKIKVICLDSNCRNNLNGRCTLKEIEIEFHKLECKQFQKK